MPDPKEELLQYVWQHRLLKPQALKSVSGKTIRVIKPGEINFDSGPDFFNARVEVEGITLAGNIEIHVKSSDWVRHGHEKDKSYDNIILHVVYKHDLELQQNTKFNVEVLEVKSLLPESVLTTYINLLQSKKAIPCSQQLSHVHDLKFTAWVERMYVERLEQKTAYIEKLFEAYNGDFAQTFYAVLLRNFGFKVNALPFELLAKQLPLSVLLKHSDQLLQLEALLFGCAGFLDESFRDKYPRQLQNEFEHLQRKYRLVPLQKELFKFSRLRPANFPGLRLAQLALLMHTRPQLFTAPHHFTAYDEILTLLKAHPENYWRYHYQLDGKESKNDLQLGEQSVNNIIINSFCNFFFFYFRKTARQDAAKIPMELASRAAFENNAKTRLYKAKSGLLTNACDSQGLIHLHDSYCRRKRCLQCGIGQSIIR